MRTIQIGLLVLLAAAVSVCAAEVKVIANSGVPGSSVSAADLKAVFLATKSSLDGARIEPVLE